MKHRLLAEVLLAALKQCGRDDAFILDPGGITERVLIDGTFGPISVARAALRHRSL
jgi:hypothetical protein